MLRLPGWLVFLVFVPLQVWLFLEILDVWGFWRSLLFFLALGFLGNRAARAPWLRSALFPQWGERWEERRHVFQGVLFLLAALAWVLPRASDPVPAAVLAWTAALPQPWVPLAFLATLVKASVR